MTFYYIKSRTYNFHSSDKIAQDILQIKEEWEKEQAEEEETFAEVFKCMEEAQTLLKFVHQVSKLINCWYLRLFIITAFYFLIIMKDEGPKVFK